MIKREIIEELLSLATQFPVVTVLGPRQSGKTTLVREAFPDKPYINLEQPKIRERLELDPEAFFAAYPGGAILDEVQRVPELLSYIQVIVDEQQQPGQFILTGSHQFLLHKSITQSLAGRVALLTLLPLSISELQAANYVQTDDEYLLRGFYPRIYDKNIAPYTVYDNYFKTYIERDVRELINVKDLNSFSRFMQLCASRIGQIINYSSLSNELGISSHTTKHWISILEASYIIVLLQPYYENLGKRLIKSPKLYFVDVGLASYLLDIENTRQLARDRARGNLFENMIIMELYKYRYNHGKNPAFYFYRDQTGNEVDLIYKRADELIPIEIKSTKTFHKEFLKNLAYFANLVGKDRCPEKYLIYNGDSTTLQETKILNYLVASEILHS